MKDWEKIESGQLDAIIFEHKDHYAVFTIINGNKIRYILQKESLLTDLKERGINKFELNERINEEYDYRQIMNIKIN